MHRRVASILLVATAVAAAVGVGSAPAQADDPIFSVNYPINGSTHIKATDSDMALGPGTLHADLDLTTGGFTGSVSLPPATGSFTEFGIVPVVATTEFIEAAPTTGSVDLNTGATQAQAHITLKLTSLKVAGLPVLVGNDCQTQTPATIGLASGPGFNVLTGGDVSGTYTIPDFAHCLLATGLINLTIPGPGNTITLTLGAATF
ncbi:MAG TPA: hypothetical protein VGJ07_07360 [Rugosimonospora sp.]